jgi:hypothetical protein
MIASTTVRKPQTTWQRALSQAKKLQPETRQQGQSHFFTVASTSVEGGIHHVTLGPNPANVIIDSYCDCGGTTRYRVCLHVVSALLQYSTNLEERLWKGADLIVQTEDFKTDTEAGLEAMYSLFQDLLNRYEWGVELIRAIEAGQDINEFRGRVKPVEVVVAC